MTKKDTTTGTESRTLKCTIHLELKEGAILARSDIDAVSLWAGELTRRIHELEEKLNIK